MDNYNRIGVASSLRNYWRVLRMHILDKANRDFDPRDRRDIRNVRYWFLRASEAPRWRLGYTSISIYLSMSMASAFSLRRSQSSASMISTFSSIYTGCLIIWHSRMSGSGFKLPPAYLRPPFSVADRAPCSTLGSNLTIPMSRMYPPTIQRSQVPAKPGRLWTISQWTKSMTWRATVTAIPISPGMVTATVTATAISARFITITRIATPMTILRRGPKKLGRSYIAISLSVSLLIKLLGNPTWSLWRRHFCTPKGKTTIRECEQICIPSSPCLSHPSSWQSRWPVADRYRLQKNVGHRRRRRRSAILPPWSLHISRGVRWRFRSYVRKIRREYISGADPAGQEELNGEMETSSSRSSGIPGAITRCGWSGHLADRTIASQHVDPLPQASRTESGFQTFFHPV